MKKNFKFIARNAAKKQIGELKKIGHVFNHSFLKTIDAIHKCKGHIICSGVGKSRIIADRTSKLFSSVGIPSFSISAQDFSHGDSGAINTKKDILLVFSYSGDSVELTDLINFSSRYHVPLIGVASKKNSLLLKSSDIRILLPKVKEIDPTGLVPTSSFALTVLAMDCLCICLMEKNKFSAAKFRKFHSGGQIGKQLITCKEIMHIGKNLPLVSKTKTIKETISVMNKGSLGLAVIIGPGKKVLGFCSDGDIRKSKFSNDELITKIYSKRPYYVSENTLVSKAITIMNKKKITSLLCSSEEDYKKNKVNFKLKGIVHMHSAIKVQ